MGLMATLTLVSEHLGGRIVSVPHMEDADPDRFLGNRSDWSLLLLISEFWTERKFRPLYIQTKGLREDFQE